ncbi:hypothetical protein [Bradyrhizobium elkanii]|uniref:hypothetical protein n=1 Tax=Bradyrhizobium elkanii TaxID=29448 RepID=UPI003D1B001B
MDSLFGLPVGNELGKESGPGAASSQGIPNIAAHLKPFAVLAVFAQVTLNPGFQMRDICAHSRASVSRVGSIQSARRSSHFAPAMLVRSSALAMDRRARCFQETLEPCNSVSEFGKFILCPGGVRRLGESPQLFDLFRPQTHAVVAIPNVTDATCRPTRQFALQSLQDAFDRLVSVTIASDLPQQTSGLVQSRRTPHHFFIP